MSGINLYEALGLDRSKSSEELTQELNGRLIWLDEGDHAGRHEIDMALNILGAPAKRSYYDQQLDSPTGNTSYESLSQLAYPQTAPASQPMQQSGAPSGAENRGVFQSFVAVFRTNRLVQVASAVTAAIVLFTVITTLVVSGDKTDATAGNSTSSSNTAKSKGSGSTATYEDSETESNAATGTSLDDYVLLKDGEELRVKYGEKYVYGDGREGFGKEFDEFGMTLTNPRLEEVFGKPDPNAPDDHPDSKPKKTATLLCFDFTRKKYQESSEFIDLRMHFQPIVDGKISGTSKLASGFIATDWTPGESIARLAEWPLASVIGDSRSWGFKDLYKGSFCVNASADESTELLDGTTGFAFIVEVVEPHNISPGDDELLYEFDPADAQGWRLDLKK